MQIRVLFWIRHLCFCFLIIKETSSSSCQDLLVAKSRWQTINSPNYPRKFAPQTQCNWILQASPGYRIEVSFNAFYLVGGVEQGCFSQLLKITDLYSKITDGPYCGNSRPPNVISTGKSIRITLESNAVGRTLYYEGFKAQFRQSRKPSSLRFRDHGGKWKYYSVRGGEVIPSPTTRTLAIVTRNPNEVDDNNNAAIDAKNNAVNKQNANVNEEVNVRNNAKNAPPTKEPLPPTTTRKRKLLIQRMTLEAPKATRPQKQNYVRKKVVSNDNIGMYPPKQPPLIRFENDNRHSKGKGLSSMAIAGIVVAIAMAAIIVLIIVIYALCCRRRRRNKMRSGKTTTSKKIKKADRLSSEYDRQYRTSKCQQRHNERNKQSQLPGAPHRSRTSETSQNRRSRSSHSRSMDEHRKQKSSQRSRDGRRKK